MKKFVALLCLLVIVCGLAACSKTENADKASEKSLSIKTTLYANHSTDKAINEVEFKLTGELPGKKKESGDFSGRIEVKESDKTKHVYEDLQYCWVDGMLLLYWGNPTAEMGQGMLCWIDPENLEDAVLADRNWREQNRALDIYAFVSEELTDAEARSIGTRINQISNVHKAQFVHREDAWEDFVAEHENDPAFSGVDATTMRHRFVITVERTEDIETTISQIAETPGIVKVSATLWAPESLYILSREQNAEKMHSLLEKLPKLPE